MLTMIALLAQLTVTVSDLRTLGLESSYIQPIRTADGTLGYLAQRVDATWLLINPQKILPGGQMCLEFVPNPWISKIQSMLYVQVPVNVDGKSHMITYGYDFADGSYPYAVRPIRFDWCR